MNQDSNFLGGSFGNTDNVRTPVQEKKKKRAPASYRLFFLKNSCIQFHINSTRVISLAKQKKLSFSNMEISKPLPAPIDIAL